MANREKKSATGKKLTVDDVIQKEGSETTLIDQNETGKIIKRRRRINPANKAKKAVAKKVLALTLKAKDKKPKFSKKIVNALLSNVEIKKNGIKLPTKRIIKKKPEIAGITTEEAAVEKKIKKSANNTTKSIKTENSNSLSKIDETIDSILKQLAEDSNDSHEIVKIRKPRMKKIKIESATLKPAGGEVVIDTVSETIEDVMKDLTSLLKQEEVSEKLVTKPLKENKSRHLPLDDNITIDASAKHLIDMLDLSVSKNQKITTFPERCIRRHSIEKVSNSWNTFSASGILKKKSNSKIRTSIDGIIKRFSPYKTPTDLMNKKKSPGRPRKIKEKNILGNIIGSKKMHKSIGSECGSKTSGFESDSSSLSDLSANLDNSKKDIKPSISNGVEDNIKSSSLTDDNSNLCSNINDEIELNTTTKSNSYPKVPEKSILLDIMKQAFNDINIDQIKEELMSDIPAVSTNQSDNMHLNLTELETESVSDSVANNTEPEMKQESGALDGKDELSLQSPKPNAQFVIDEALLQSKVEEIIKSMEDDDFNEPTKVETCENDDKIVFRNVEETEVPVNVELKLENSIEEPIGTNSETQSLDSIATKESILQALGLQSLKAVEEAKLKEKVLKPDYTGSLKTVIKINRVDKNKRRNILKLSSYKYEVEVQDQPSKLKENLPSNTWKVQQSTQSSDTGGAPRKSHNSNRINMDGSSEHNSDGDTAPTENDDPYRVLVIPEKASSFSIHPGRLCKDECTYCFGKFGLFDTPCHIAQMKSVERQDKILEAEKHLMRDSCLCDACYRHVDRKSNTPSYLNKGSKRNSIIAPGPRQNHCHVLSCSNVATHILRRKWIIKMRKSVSKLINIDLDNLGLHSIPICDEHYIAVEHLMICAMCKRRLTRNQIHYLGPETNDLNTALNSSGIPVKLFDKPVVCKLCRYFASLILRPTEDRPENATNFFRDYRKRLLHFHNIEVMEDEEEEPSLPPLASKEKSDREAPTKKRKRLHHKTSNNIGPPVLEPQVDLETLEQPHSAPSETNSTENSRSESPSDYMVDYNTLIPNIAMDCGSDLETSKKATPQIKNKSLTLTSNSSISVRELFPGEEELGLQCRIDFSNTKEKTPEGWERCSSVIQYDTETKMLWQDLQKPYGNQSSFLRHLVLLEKYFRNGDLVLAPNATHHSVSYSEAVQNRLRAYDNIPKSLGSPISLARTGIITTKDTSIINAANIPKNTPITITQINNITPTIVNKTRVPPPGLISLHSGIARPKTPGLVKSQQTNKIKIPITKNWRPTLIPIDPTKKSDKDKKPGYVKVVSNGKPYYITVDDYNRMCAIKKSYDLKQKRLLEAAQLPNPLKNISIRKGLIISNTSSIKAETESENNIDKIVENNDTKLDNPVMILPKIPKSLTVIPQTVQQNSSSTLNIDSVSNS